MGRWGWSALSKGRSDVAYKEEALVDKQTGEFMIKTKDIGDIISYNYLNRLNDHKQNVIKTAQDMRIFGNMYSIEFNKEFPKICENGKILSIQQGTDVLSGLNTNDPNFVDTDFIKIPYKFNKFLLSIDLSSLVVKENIYTVREIDPTIEFTYFVRNIPIASNDFHVSMRLSELKKHVFTIPKLTYDGDKPLEWEMFIIKNINIKKENYDVVNTQYRDILHSIFIVVE